MMPNFYRCASSEKDFWKARPFIPCHFNPFMTHHTCRAILNSDSMVYMGHPVFTALSLMGDQMYRSSLGRYVPWTGPSRSLRSQCSSNIFALKQDLPRFSVPWRLSRIYISEYCLDRFAIGVLSL